MAAPICEVLTSRVKAIVQIDYRYGPARSRSSADLRELDGRRLYVPKPDVIVMRSRRSISMWRRCYKQRATVPIVFVQVVDPVGSGFVDSLARPGGNATGLTNFEYGLSAKWLELLKQIAPGVTRAAVLVILVPPPVSASSAPSRLQHRRSG